MKNIMSAGILVFRQAPHLEILLCHMGGPYWKEKDKGAWGIAKGLVEDSETLLDAAVRECKEEIGLDVNKSVLIELAPVKMSSGKIIHAWGSEVSKDLQIKLISNTFQIEWPPKSGMLESFPEVDECRWFALEDALEKIIPAQRDLCIQISRITSIATTTN